MINESELSDYKIGLVIGIKYRANFKIEDTLGEIVDSILYKNNSFFNPSVFPYVRNKVNEKILHNESTQDKLTINNSNIVLDIFYGDYFQLQDYETILEKFNSEILEGIMRKHKIQEISRIGVINRYLFPMENLAKEFIAKTIGETFDGINDINLRFSKKLPVKEALVKEEVLDYNNIIFNVVKLADKEELFISVDYQKHFDPYLSSTGSLKFENFIKDKEKFLNNRYLEWINNNYLELNESQK